MGPLVFDPDEPPGRHVERHPVSDHAAFLGYRVGGSLKTELVTRIDLSGIVPAENVVQTFFCRERGKPSRVEPLLRRAARRPVHMAPVVPPDP